MIKAAITIGSAAILAGLVSVMPAPGVQAGTPNAQIGAAAALTQPSGAETPPVDGVCSQQRAWPYYDQGCLADFDARWRGEPRKVRLVTTDRLN
ncbi:MAG: hypothetical protein ACJ8EN_08920 [Xanthobacteraceae bacterium]|jgi:hypothetical protein